MDEAELVAKTLEFLPGTVGDPDDARWLRQAAEAIRRSPPREWWVCPVCEEAECDEGCPLEGVRAAASVA